MKRVLATLTSYFISQPAITTGNAGKSWKTTPIFLINMHITISVVRGLCACTLILARTDCDLITEKHMKLSVSIAFYSYALWITIDYRCLLPLSTDGIKISYFLSGCLTNQKSLIHFIIIVSATELAVNGFAKGYWMVCNRRNNTKKTTRVHLKTISSNLSNLQCNLKCLQQLTSATTAPWLHNTLLSLSRCRSCESQKVGQWSQRQMWGNIFFRYT